MVQRQAGDGAGGGRRNHIGRVETAAEANLHHAEIGRMAREQHVRGGCQHLEHRHGCAGVHPFDLAQHAGQGGVGHQFARHPEALVQPHQMRRGADVHPQPRRLAHGAQKGAGGALAVGAGDMDHRRQMQLRVAQIGQQTLHASEAQIDELGVERLQPA